MVSMQLKNTCDKNLVFHSDVFEPISRDDKISPIGIDKNEVSWQWKCSTKFSFTNHLLPDPDYNFIVNTLTFFSISLR